jgi:hypothetical protein
MKKVMGYIIPEGIRAEDIVSESDKGCSRSCQKRLSTSQGMPCTDVKCSECALNTYNKVWRLAIKELEMKNEMPELKSGMIIKVGGFTHFETPDMSFLIAGDYCYSLNGNGYDYKQNINNDDYPILEVYSGEGVSFNSLAKNKGELLWQREDPKTAALRHTVDTLIEQLDQAKRELEQCESL